jgi:hypothetical protein
MNNFEPKPVTLKPGDLVGCDVQFFEIDGYPVVYVNNGKNGVSGAVALFGEKRTFPVESLFSYDGCELSRDEFFQSFPATKIFFEQPEKQAA